MAQSKANIIINGKSYGVLVRQKKYTRQLKIASSPFTNPTIEIKDELEYMKEHALIKLLLNGNIIEL